MTPRKPAFFTRLSNLIVIQVVFIFSALALILFGPKYESQVGDEIRSLEEQVAAAGERYAEGLALVPPSGFTPRSLAELFADVRSGEALVQHVALLRRAESDRFEIVYATSDIDSYGRSDESSGFCDQERLADVFSAAQATHFRPTIDATNIVYYRPVRLPAAEDNLVLAVAAQHDLSVSSRGVLKYAIFVLFLVSTLLSLLTLKFLGSRFRAPFKRLISGFERTAEGELCHMVEPDSDPELGALAQSYNRMARKLHEDQQQIKAYTDELCRSNQALSEKKAFMTALIERSPLIILVTDPDQRVVIFNQAAERAFGYAGADIVGHSITDLAAETWGSLPEGTDGFEAVCRCRDGSTFAAWVQASSISTDEGEVACLYVCRDITESKRHQDMMIQLDRYYTRGQMAGDIAHEINNYLAVLMGNVELMPIMLKRGDMEKVEKKLTVMHASLQKIATFSDGLLDSPPERVCLEPTSLNQLVENVIAFLKPQNRFDQIEFRTELSGETPVMQLDQSQMQQLLVNLIYNASEALTEVETDKCVTIKTGMIDEANLVAGISVRDNGPGVVTDKVELLFEERFTTKRKGHGLGLITCRKIADNHEGRMVYRCDRGAVFEVQLPVRIAGEAVSEQTPTISTASPH